MCSGLRAPRESKRIRRVRGLDSVELFFEIPSMFFSLVFFKDVAIVFECFAVLVSEEI